MKKVFLSLIIIFSLCLIVFAQAENNGITALVRGNTAVVRIPHEWLYTYALAHYPPEERLDAFDSSRYIVDDEWLQQSLNETDYASFKEDFFTNGYASLLIIRDVGIISDSTTAKYDRLQMHKRFIDDAWFLVFRQEPLNFNTACAYYPTTVFAEHEIEVFVHAEAEIPKNMITIQSFDGTAKERFIKGDYSFEVFSALGENIVVITTTSANSVFDENAILQIDKDISVNISGYINHNQITYCCVLTDAELQVLENKTSIYLVFDSLEINT